MRIREFHLGIALLAGLVLVSSSCQSDGKKPVLAKAPVSATPSLKPSADPKPTPPVQAAKTGSEQAPAPQSDAVEDLIQRSESEYQAGENSYKAGDEEAAKASFERAFNTLAQSPGGIASDPRLQREADRIVDGVNSLEALNQKEGDNFAEQKSEPAPIDEANQVTFPVDPNVTAKAAAEIKATRSDLPLTLNDAVSSYINYFSSRGHGVLERGLIRSGMYRDMISKTLKEEGVPQDLIYLAQAESGFHPLALSHAGARGLWQFIASRATGYGLARNSWIDEREDPEKSTRAAAHHLKDLYNQFGDWYLAMAAYNSGPLTVQWAVQRTGYADFWELYRRNVLPAETKNYVPIILAVTIMAKNPEQYGLEDIVPDKPLAMDRLMIDYQVDLRLVAECVDSTPAALQELNPSLLRMVTPNGGAFELHLPAGTAETYQTEIAAVPKDVRAWWRYHEVKPGDTLASIARSYHTTAKSILEVNKLQSEELEADSKLIIPVAPGRHPDSEVTAYSRRTTRYKVRRGDTLESVADNFGVSTEHLRRWNGLRPGAHLRQGRVLLVHLPLGPGQHDSVVAAKSAKRRKTNDIQRTAKGTATTAAKSPRRVLHKVQRGETLYSIASTYNTTVSALRHNNARITSNLRAGDVLVIRESR